MQTMSIDLLQVGTPIQELQVQVLEIVQKLHKMKAIYTVADNTGSIQLSVKGGKQFRVGDSLVIHEGRVSAGRGLKSILSSKVARVELPKQQESYLHSLDNNQSVCVAKYGIVCVRLIMDATQEPIGFEFLLNQPKIGDLEEQKRKQRATSEVCAKKPKRAKKEGELEEVNSNDSEEVPESCEKSTETIWGLPCGIAVEETPQKIALKIFCGMTNMSHGTDFRMISNIAPIGTHSKLDDDEDEKHFSLFFLAEAKATQKTAEVHSEHEEDEIGWFEYEEARQMVGSDNDRNVLFLAKKYLKKAAEVGVLGPKWEALSTESNENHDDSEPSLDINLSTLFKDISAQCNNKDPIPVTLLSGFLGSGKTTLMKYILENREGLKVALIVNDMAEINIDSQLIKNGSSLKQVEEKMVELQNGCICCTLREDLLVEIVQLTRDRKFDYLLIESSGISEPLQVAETFTFEDSEKNSLSKYARLDTCVTVVDSLNFSKDYESRESLEDRRLAATKTDERKITDLLIDQIEFADVVILNKMDLVSPEEASRLESIVHHLNPHAVVLKSSFSKVPLQSILNTKLFDFKKAERNAGWLKELRGQHTPESLEYGVSSFVFRSSIPFHPKRLHDLLFQNLQNTPLKKVIRSKGFCWLATRHEGIGEWTHSGRVWKIHSGGSWLATLPYDEWGLDEEETSSIMKKWNSSWGDRRQEIVFIGEKMDKEGVENEIKKCLLSPEEMKEGPESWLEFEDPFEEWESFDDDMWIE